MINVEVKLDKGITKIDVSGHAGYDEEGKDIVCAGVSAVVQTAILGLQAIAARYPSNVAVKISGYSA